MSFTLFIDESGQDRRESPHEVLAGIAVEDRDLWNLITSIQQLEHEVFGGRYGVRGHELKAKKLLSNKVFGLAAGHDPLEAEDRRRRSRACLDRGQGADMASLAALAQAKLDFVSRTLTLRAQQHCRAFASVIPREAPGPAARDFLWKNYAYVFERYFYFFEDMSPDAMGFIVFDELERSQSHLLIDQMGRYFLDTATGRMRSGRIIPKPFFAHGDLTTVIQVADFIAYVVAWGVQVSRTPPPSRENLGSCARQVMDLKYQSVREIDRNPNFKIWSFALIKDLRATDERRYCVEKTMVSSPRVSISLVKSRARLSTDMMIDTRRFAPVGRNLTRSSAPPRSPRWRTG